MWLLLAGPGSPRALWYLLLVWFLELPCEGGQGCLWLCHLLSYQKLAESHEISAPLIPHQQHEDINCIYLMIN